MRATVYEGSKATPFPQFCIEVRLRGLTGRDGKRGEGRYGACVLDEINPDEVCPLAVGLGVRGYENSPVWDEWSEGERITMHFS